jgi:hypothetical protein
MQPAAAALLILATTTAMVQGGPTGAMAQGSVVPMDPGSATPRPDSSEPEAATSADEVARAKAECTERWLKAEAAGIVYGWRTQDGVPAITVDEGTWNTISYEVKLGMTETIICAAVGPDRMIDALDFRSHRTNRVVGEWRWGPFSGGRLTVR